MTEIIRFYSKGLKYCNGIEVVKEVDKEGQRTIVLTGRIHLISGQVLAFDQLRGPNKIPTQAEVAEIVAWISRTCQEKKIRLAKRI